MTRSHCRRIFRGAGCLLLLLLSACQSAWVPAGQAATPADELAATPSLTATLPLDETPVIADTLPVAMTDTPARASRATRTPAPTRTPSSTYTPPSPEDQLATFYAEATQTATAAGTPLKGQRAPTRTRTPTPTPTITPTPLPPFAVLRIDRPGRMSKVVSPLKTELGVTPGADGKVHLDLIGEDGRYIFRQVLSYGNYQGKSIGITPEITFDIDAVSELARLVVTIYDEFGRVRHLTSTDIILLSIGENEMVPTSGQREAYIVRSPKAGDVITGGVVHLTGLARPVNDSPLIFELIDETGKVVGEKLISVEPPSGDLSHTPFTVDIPYNVSEPTPVRLTMHQESTSRIPGPVELASLELILAP